MIIWRILQQYELVPQLLLAIGLNAATILTGMGLLGIGAWIIASAALHPPLASLGAAIAGVRALGLGRAVLRYGERYVSHDLTFRWLQRLRVALYGHLLEGKGQNHTRGDWMQCFIGDVDLLQYLLLRGVIPAGAAVLVGGLGFLWFCYFLPAVAGIVLIMVLASAWAWPALWQRMTVSLTWEVERRQYYNTLVVVLEGLPELLAAGRVKDFEAKLKDAGCAWTEKRRCHGEQIAWLQGLAGMTLQFGLWCVLWCCGMAMAAGLIDKILAIVLFIMVQGMWEGILPLSSMRLYWSEAWQAFLRLGLTEEKQGKQVERIIEKNADGPCCEAGVELEKIYVAGDRGEYELGPLSLQVKPGRRLAIVGASGAGKTTLLHLLAGLAKPLAGRALWRGLEMHQWDEGDLRRDIGFLQQQGHIFYASVADNLRMARPDATDGELWEVLSSVNLDSLVRQWPDQMDTLVGKNERPLSGGESRRLLLARTLLKNCAAWILDEPTRGLDCFTEKLLLDRICQRQGQRMLVVATHRLVDLECFDEIITLQQGKIAEQGSFEELIAAKGIFQKMWQVQRDVMPL